MTTEQFLELLEGVERRHGHWMALCPAHDDRNPSLDIKEGDDAILLKCHAGCETRDVVGALGLSLRDLFYKPRDLREEEPEAEYVYVDEHGHLLFTVKRFEGKVFRQVSADGTWGLGETRRVLYRLPEVLASQTIYLTEGEKDADAIGGAFGDSMLYGVAAATCNPMGAGKWRDEYSESLRDKDVIIVVDRDEPGRLHAEKVRASLDGVAASVKLVQAKTGKDAADHIAAGFHIDQFVPYRGKSRHGGVVISAAEMAENTYLDLSAREDDVMGYSSPWPSMRELDLRGGRLYVCGGYTSDGKTTLALQLFRHLSQEAVRVGLFSLEMVERDLRNRLLAHATGIELWRLDRPWLLNTAERGLVTEAAEKFKPWDSDIIFDTGADMEKIAEYQRDGEYDFLIVDHLHRIGKTREGEEAAIAREIGGAKNLALDYNIPVWVVCQLRRQPPGMLLAPPALTDFKGSSAIEQEADMALAVYLNRGPDGKPDKFGSGQLDVLKNRHGARPTWRVNLHHETMTFEEFDHVAETSTEAATATEVAGQSGSPLDVLDGWLDDDE